MSHIPSEQYRALNEAVQAVKHAANRFPIGEQHPAQKAAAQVLLDHLPVGYRIWPVDQDPEVTLKHLAGDFLETARHLEMVAGADGDSTVLSTLDRIVHQLGYVRSPAGVEVSR